MQQRSLGEKKWVEEESLMVLVACLAELSWRNHESYHILAESCGKRDKIKLNFYCTRGITPKRVTSGGARFRGTAPGLLSSEETLQQWRAIGNTELI